MSENSIVTDSGDTLDPSGDADRLKEHGEKKNFAKVGSSRPSTLLFTYGPGAVMDLPHFTVMPGGLDDLARIYARREGAPAIHAPRLLDAVRVVMKKPTINELRAFPWAEKRSLFSSDGGDLGVSARVFPQWLRCTGCDKLAKLAAFDYRNTRGHRPDEAQFFHKGCTGRPSRSGASAGGRRGPKERPAVSARYLLACTRGHLDEFPYALWVHGGGTCPKAEAPKLRMTDRTAGKGANAVVHCDSCGARRGMNEAQGAAGTGKLPRCRGRHPHLGGFERPPCGLDTQLMLIGASNLWFPAVQSIIDMPQLDDAEKSKADAERVRVLLGDLLEDYRGSLRLARRELRRGGLADVEAMSDAALAELLDMAANPPAVSVEDLQRRRDNWDPIDLLVPEWRYLLRDPAHERHEDKQSGLTLSPREVHADTPPKVSRVLAVDRLRKVNAIVGFTRIDDLDRVDDVEGRLAPLWGEARPTWTVATEDRGEGVFLQLAEDAVAAWEGRVCDSDLWGLHKEAHRRNFTNRFSETAEKTKPDERFRPPRYWLLHTLSHVLIREMAMYSGYGAASLSERIYAWRENGNDRPAAAGVLICTTASDSDGTLGGLVRLSEPERLATITRSALRRAARCSSDPVCSMRTPREPEDFLHGAACHCCVMASETTCERANRFLDRRFLLSLPGSDLGFFGGPHGW